jgi:hypothetical protein
MSFAATTAAFAAPHLTRRAYNCQSRVETTNVFIDEGSHAKLDTLLPLRLQFHRRSARQIMLAPSLLIESPLCSQYGSAGPAMPCQPRMPSCSLSTDSGTSVLGAEPSCIFPACLQSPGCPINLCTRMLRFDSGERVARSPPKKNVTPPKSICQTKRNKQRQEPPIFAF